jgi:L-lactate utilization protein LutC
MYGEDVLAGNWRKRRTTPEVDAEPDLVVEDADSGFCGAVVGFESGAVVLEDRHGRRRNFPLLPAAFLLDGAPVTLRRPPPAAAPAVRQRTASGSVAVAGVRAQVAKASRIWVEGIHDAALVERIWGDDLRIEGVVVHPLDGIDELAGRVREFDPGPERRLGVLVDHLVAGSKESRIVAGVTSSYVLVTGHPYVDVWQAVKPAKLGIRAWPVVPPGQPWKEGVCAALGVAEPAEMWRRILSRVTSYQDVETPLINAVERLIDFVTVPAA